MLIRFLFAPISVRYQPSIDASWFSNHDEVRGGNLERRKDLCFSGVADSRTNWALVNWPMKCAEWSAREWKGILYHEWQLTKTSIRPSQCNEMAAGKRFAIATRDFARDLASSILFMNFYLFNRAVQQDHDELEYFLPQICQLRFPFPSGFLWWFIEY